MSEFGDALKAALKMRRMSQRQLASNIGTSERMVSRYVKGHAVPRKGQISSIEQTLALDSGSLQKYADLDKSDSEDEETRQEKILKAWKRGDRTPSEVSKITGYPMEIIGKYLPLYVNKEYKK